MRARLLVEGEPGRALLRRLAARDLPAGMALVRTVDLVGEDRLVLQTPLDAGAVVVAREPPTILPGGLTALVSHVLVRSDATDAVEHRVAKGGAVETLRVRLAIEAAA